MKGLKNARLGFVLMGVLLLSSACKNISAAHPRAIDDIRGALNSGVKSDQDLNNKMQKQRYIARQNAIRPNLQDYLKSGDAPVRFNVSAKQMAAKDFFTGLVSGTSTNMIVHPDVKGTISLQLKNVTVLDALNAARDVYGYDYKRTSFGYEIMPAIMQTRMFHVNYLDVKRNGKSYTNLTSGQVSTKIGTVSTGSNSGSGAGSAGADAGRGLISSIETTSEIHFWEDLEKTLLRTLSPLKGRSVTVNRQTGIIVVKAFPNELSWIDRYINNMQANLQRQVVIEAKILEINLSDGYQAGVDWGAVSKWDLTNTEPEFNSGGLLQRGNQAFPGTDLKQLQSNMFAFNLKGNISALIRLLQTQGNVQVLSSPHIATVNNQKAVIKVGQDQFFVTAVSTSNTVVGAATIPSQDVSLTPFFSGVTLDVTPEISSDNSIILHIHPMVSEVTEQQKNIVLGSNAAGNGANTLTLPLASSSIRESDNVVRARNGQVIVIGGLMKNSTQETTAQTPVAGKIPFFGALFRRTGQTSTKSELVILLKPIVVDNQTWVNRLEGHSSEVETMARDFHAGGLPKVFGNEQERRTDS